MTPSGVRGWTAPLTNWLKESRNPRQSENNMKRTTASLQHAIAGFAPIITEETTITIDRKFDEERRLYVSPRFCPPAEGDLVWESGDLSQSALAQTPH